MITAAGVPGEFDGEVIDAMRLLPFGVGDWVRIVSPGHAAHGRRYRVDEVFDAIGMTLYGVGPFAMPAAADGEAVDPAGAAASGDPLAGPAVA